MWNKDEIKGKSDQMTGKVKKAAGDLTDDDDLKNEGSVEEIEGKAEDTFGSARRRVGNALDDLGNKIKR